MFHYEPKDLSVQEVHRLLLGGVAPRPIALVSTISFDDVFNLSPFSFFNAFGANPPIVAFSPARRGRDASFKDTYNNLNQTRECVIQAVTFEMVEQVSLASTEFPSDVNEFIKSGLTAIDSDLVKPKRVKESPFQMECVLRDILSYGDGGSSANLAVCEVVKFHVAEDIFQDGIIHPDLINLVGRMSGEFYTKASGKTIFSVEKPNQRIGIGFDQLPQYLKDSVILSANDLAKLANITSIPSPPDVDNFIQEVETSTTENLEISDEALFRYQRNEDYLKMFKCLLVMKSTDKTKYEYCIKTALDCNDTQFAWKAACYSNRI
jgi:flavin reductase (DIM6/NTAB) family NADH-FMN oxidoreductase RutF